jgi:hypothetical protein
MYCKRHISQPFGPQTFPRIVVCKAASQDNTVLPRPKCYPHRVPKYCIMYCMGVTSPRVWLYLSLNKNAAGQADELLAIKHGESVVKGLGQQSGSRMFWILSQYIWLKFQPPVGANALPQCTAQGECNNCNKTWRISCEVVGKVKRVSHVLILSQYRTGHN